MTDLGAHPQSFDPVVLGRDLRIGIHHTFPRGGSGPGSGTTLWEPRAWLLYWRAWRWAHPCQAWSTVNSCLLCIVLPAPVSASTGQAASTIPDHSGCPYFCPLKLSLLVSSIAIYCFFFKSKNYFICYLFLFEAASFATESQLPLTSWGCFLLLVMSQPKWENSPFSLISLKQCNFSWGSCVK